MFKGLFGLLLTSLLTAGWTVIHGYTEDFVVDNGVLVSVNDKTNYSLRIYAEKNVTSIAEHAFDDCHFVTMMISTPSMVVTLCTTKQELRLYLPPTSPTFPQCTMHWMLLLKN